MTQPKKRVMRALGLRDATVHARKSEFRWGDHIGSGTFGEVTRCTWLTKNPPMEVAVKVVAKSMIPDLDRQLNLLNRILKLRHPHVVQLLDWFQSKDHVYMISELAKGGELFDHTIERGNFTDRQARLMMRDVCSAVEHIHSQGLVHRDLKPENLFVRGDPPYEPPLDIVVADFGVAAYIEKLDGTQITLNGICGSPGYTAPEVYRRQPYGKPVDIWALGVLAFILITGRFPFGHLSGPDFLAEVERAPAKFPKKFGITPDAENFIVGCLQVDSSKRWTATEALNHPWLSKPESEDILENGTVASAADTESTRFELPHLVKSELEDESENLAENKLSTDELEENLSKKLVLQRTETASEEPLNIIVH
ncbi:CAMK/CAMK1 protein kinase [Phakopsora pachyrhizi]|uniref:CAMK/CAMK1 protein kinase n=1 Tax=Phakopsora pachyrhizi TaxID=170000 RepID=A0AAV0BC84_PHAPC|nr:CAMK/CAMK1 protein kinase [Phakopsora pachyrhizi]CAH7669987.1 CAMK/CAMK1 protein kinase [Phakopsora pachyrhizi]CAH7683856.1 CAMK/CAMK1 protein kinase [Phakopsora pachyrhizi]